jgi:hypothetical protein
VCVSTRRFNGGLDSGESSPFATLSRGAFSASSLVTPIRPDSSRDRVVPVCNTDLSLPTPPHTALVDRGRTASRTGQWPCRSACAPRRIRQTDYLGALGKLAGGRFLVTDARKGMMLIDEFDLRSTTAELIRVMRHKFPDAHRWGDVTVRDLTVQRVRLFPGDPVHVLRLRTGEFVCPAQVRPRVGEDGSDYPSDSSRGNWRGLARPNGSSIPPRLRTLGPVRGRKKPSRKTVAAARGMDAF